MLSSESPESPESPVLASTHSLPLELPGVAQIYVNKPWCLGGVPPNHRCDYKANKTPINHQQKYSWFTSSPEIYVFLRSVPCKEECVMIYINGCHILCGL